MRVLSRSDVRQSLGMREAILAMRDAFAQLSGSEAQVPQRAVLDVPQQDAVVLIMPARLAAIHAMTCKVVSVYPRNPARGMKLIHALVLLIDENSGRPLAALEGGYLTGLRTGAASGVATDLLARKEARVLACFGAGTQAAFQVEAVCEVRAIERVWIKGRSTQRAEQLAERLRGVGRIPSDVRVAETAQQALAEADIVCTATTSSSPVFDGRDLRPGTHVNAIGSYTRAMQEVDIATLQQARIVVDSRAACQAEAGDLAAALGAGAIGGPETWTELGEILLGRAPGRQSESEITYFKSVGNAAQDAAAAQRAFLQASRLGLGQEIDLEMDPEL
jgi:alanine dehydrogenase